MDVGPRGSAAQWDDLVSTTSAPILRSALIDDYVGRIEAHLGKLAQGRDPLGHLFAIERLARGARAEVWASQRESERGSKQP